MNVNEIIEGDCLDVMPTLTENSVDSVITDPPYGLSFMGKDWDKGVPGVAYWKEALRVCKPGAFLLAFGGTRTFHRLSCAIEDAGWEIRDCLMWLYGSGFPKSLDVSKAIDRAAGAVRPTIGIAHDGVGNTASSIHKEEGFAASRERVYALTAPATTAAHRWQGWGTALKPAWEPIILARKPLEGTVAENVQKHGTGALNIDGGRIRTGDKLVRPEIQRFDNTAYGRGLGFGTQEEPQGRWPANVLLDEDAAAMLDEQSGISKSTGGRIGNATGGIAVPKADAIKGDPGFGDVGGASRFFYCAKASKRERGEGNNHPTVKPIALLSYLTKLVTPPGGLILDPFIGSGSTAVAAVRKGFRFIGIEKQQNYAGIARSRVAAHVVDA